MSNLAHILFEYLPVDETCTWYGTEWVGSHKDGYFKPCGAPTVGAGLFCEPGHQLCEYHSVCERHKKPLQQW